jgi:uncharacterized protein involved in exopolysaccharide biosynthesis
VQLFKARNGLTDSGSGYLEERQMSEISTQLSIARANTTEVKARLDWILRADSGSGGDAMAMAVLKDPQTESFIRS